MNSIVIVGGGHAAAPLCAALAEAGLGAQVHLVCGEPHLPYQRPPLSKAYLKNPAEALQGHRGEAWYAQAGITVHSGDPAVSIDRAARTLTLRSGAVLPYGQLVLATGTRARRLPQLQTPAGGLANVAVLRDAGDAERLRGLLAGATSLTVLGGGFIGLEVAATARAQGLVVRVVEVAPRLLGRSVSAELAAHVLAVHRASGITVDLGAQLGAFEHDGQRLQAMTVDGQRLPVDLLLLGIGAEPEDTLARAAGLHCDNGIVVDASLRTSDPAILAIGDVARFPVSTHWAPAGGLLRLESVQNATDQARAAALTLQGQSPVYGALPWFWSEQGALRLQMTGLMPAPDAPGVQRHRRPGPAEGSFSILHYLGERLLCAESVNAPMDHVMSRKLMEAGRNPPPAVACDPAVALKSLLA
ncbi:NAD(P)/FAD-dependent oxidoreductase [Pseudaquabacterium pictum]|uniref:Pyridine nucleotide-disulfide oxidoreductase n=1 Tax=Pseudaquabacterium pictum TaxID=2315236 RepID=A0A480ARE5_9BURK|nr:FAD-dependent oxidoreductase [Rubrivivax pictus]GCL62867.1 pyridine nucleotide-disulfide oxidoreductase [Rubrivivax pictus]